MAYAIVRGARNTLAPRQYMRGFRGLGQATGCTDIDGNPVPCVYDPSAAVFDASGNLLTSTPGVTIAPSTAGGAPGATAPTAPTGDISDVLASLAASVPVAPAGTPVVIPGANQLCTQTDVNGNCTAVVSASVSALGPIPASVASLAASTPITAAGLTASQIAQLTAAGVQTVGQLATMLNYKPPVGAVPVATTTSVFGGLTTNQVLLIGGVGLFALLLIMTSKRR